MNRAAGMFVDIEAVADSGATVASGRFALPVTVGRGDQASLRLPESLSQLSRVHLELNERGGRLHVTDTSSNGVTRGGSRLTRGEPVRIGDREELDLPGVRLTIQRVGATPEADIHIVARVGAKPSRKVPLGGEALVVFAQGAAGAALEKRPSGFTLDDFAAEPGSAGKAVLAILSPEPGGVGLTLPRIDNAPDIRLNRAALTPGQHWMVALDVLTIGGLRLEAHARGIRAIECVNGQCRLLNAYRPEENCRWCGYKLIEGVSRMVE